MGYFSSDGSTGSSAGIGAVYIKLESGDMASIFPTNVSGSVSCKFLGSPSEKGIMLFDNKVAVPQRVTFRGVAKRDSFEILKTACEEIYDNSVKRATVYVKNGCFVNMILENVTMISTAERFDSVEVEITLTEFMEDNSTANKFKG